MSPNVLIVDPRGSATPAAVTVPPPPERLEGIPVHVIDNRKPNFDLFADQMIDELQGRLGIRRGRTVRKGSPSVGFDETELDQRDLLNSIVLAGSGD